MVKTKAVYGKRNRNLSKAQIDIFTRPESSPRSGRVLVERSQNVQVVQHGRPGESTKKAIPVEDGKHRSPRKLQKAVEVQNCESASRDEEVLSKTACTQRKAQQRPLPQPKAEQQKALSAALQNLKLTDSLESTTGPFASNTPRHHGKADPPISLHPASVSPAILAHIQPLLDLKFLSPVIEDFPGWLSARSHLSLAKIGEGSFGEVFRATSRPASSSSFAGRSAPSESGTAILKLLPLAPARGPGSRSYTSVSSAARELRLLSLLQRVPGFVEFRGACVLQGAMPERMCELWRAYRDSGRTVQSQDPTDRRRGGYPSKQLWLVIEMGDAGTCLERGGYRPPASLAREQGAEDGMNGGARSGKERYLSVRRTWDIWWGIVKALAKAEVCCGFEHRDLHLGNVCARDPSRDSAEADEEDLTLVGEDETVALGLNKTGVEVTIIDYSLSRAAVNGGGKDKEEVLFYDFMSDKQLLQGEGDSQYDVYRHMAAAMGRRSAEVFAPETNVLWLWFLLKRLLEVTIDRSGEARKLGDDRRVTVAARTVGVLNELLELTDPERVLDWQMRSAGALLDRGVEMQWFGADEILDI